MYKRAVLIGCLLLAGAPGGAHAQSPVEDLKQCVTASATDDDRQMLVRWLFASLAVHPELKSMARIEDAERVGIDRRMAAMMQRLITADCVGSVRQLPVGQMQMAFEAAFEALGQQAGIASMTHPDVVTANAELTKYLDEAAFERIFAPAP